MPAKSPILLHMLGIPGAGKTTFLDGFLVRWEHDPKPVLLGFDQVMQSLPEYQNNPDKIAAFAVCELPAREAGYRLLDSLIAARSDILFDNGGSAATHVELLRRAQDVGYRIVLVSIKTDVQEAQKRVDARAVTEGRHTPMNYLDDRARKLAELEADYRALTQHFYEMYNDGQDFGAFQNACMNMADTVLRDLG